MTHGKTHLDGDLSEAPCPFVILYDFGSGFFIGAVGGALYHGYKGFRRSPYGERLKGISSTVRLQAPLTAGRFGAWCGLLGIFNCAFVSIYPLGEKWNSILAGGFTSGSLAIRGGYKPFRNQFIFGSIIMAVFEGMGIFMNRHMAQMERPPQ